MSATFSIRRLVPVAGRVRGVVARIECAAPSFAILSRLFSKAQKPHLFTNPAFDTTADPDSHTMNCQVPSPPSEEEKGQDEMPISAVTSLTSLDEGPAFSSSSPAFQYLEEV
ncbi:hypothetical protein GN956_G11610 [Arapaima gigas]